jgi:hypothetical protein
MPLLRKGLIYLICNRVRDVNNGRKKESLDLNLTIEKPITLLKILAINGEEVRNLSIDILDDKSERKKIRVPKILKDSPLSKIETKLRCLLGLPKWQENELQKLSVEKLKRNGLAWVPKRSVQAEKDDDQANGATKEKERRRFKKHIAKLEVYTKPSKLLVMASSIFYAYIYVIFISKYAWLSLSFSF